MLPSRLVSNTLRRSVNQFTDGMAPVSPSKATTRFYGTFVDKDWADQTVDTILSEEVSFSETRKHKMDGDTCCHQNMDLDKYDSMTDRDAENVEQDGRLHVYDSSSIGLSGVMQTNVPEPYDASKSDNADNFITEHAVSLNMPGGNVSQKKKYLSGQRNVLDIEKSCH